MTPGIALGRCLEERASKYGAAAPNVDDLSNIGLPYVSSSFSVHALFNSKQKVLSELREK